jgi:NAD(P)H-nitrite reductase large subunit
LKLDELYHGMQLPWKFKIGVSGCANSCAEPAVKDIGLIGTSKGWKLLVGGSSGVKPRLGQMLAENLSDAEVLSLIDRIINYYKDHAKKQRLGEFIEEISFEKFKQEIMI